MTVARPWRPSALVGASMAAHVTAAGAVLVSPDLWPQALSVVVADHVLLGLAGMWPRSRLLGPNLVRLPASAAGRGEIALTIDDGPDAEVTPRVLDLLDAAGAKATFFCIGERVAKHAALAREMSARGHVIENHSQRHLTLFAASGPRRMMAEIVAGQDTIADTVGRVPRFFRPTAGLRNPFLDPILCRLNLRLATWTRRAFDTRCGDAATVHRRLARGLVGGDILLLHDGHAARTTAGTAVILEALPMLLTTLRSQGLRAVTLAAAA